MSSKLVKKLLQQTNRSLTKTDDENDREVLSRKRKSISKTPAKKVMTTEDVLQSHVQSILRLDHKIQTSASSVAKKSFSRHSSNIKKQQKTVSSAKKVAGGVSNSRSSTSNFAKKKPEPTFDKVKARQQREEDYYEGIAKALKKSKRQKLG